MSPKIPATPAARIPVPYSRPMFKAVAAPLEVAAGADALVAEEADEPVAVADALEELEELAAATNLFGSSVPQFFALAVVQSF